MVQQMGHRGFAVGARDADPGNVPKRIPGNGHFSVNVHTLVTQMLDGWVVPGDTGTDHNPLEIIQPGLKTGGLQWCAQKHIHTLLLKESGSMIERLACAGVDHGDVNAGLRQKTGGPHA